MGRAFIELAGLGFPYACIAFGVQLQEAHKTGQLLAVARKNEGNDWGRKPIARSPPESGIFVLENNGSIPSRPFT
jgi:hypothetical protein